MEIQEKTSPNLAQIVEYLPSNDREWLQDKIQLPEVLEVVDVLAEQVVTSRFGLRKMEMRPKVEFVDMMDILNMFSLGEQKIIVKSSPSVALNERCSGWCPWCGTMSLRMKPHQRGKAFSFSSIEEFTKKLGCYFPQKERIALYNDNDSLDWTDGKNSYTDVVKLFFDNIEGIRIYTSTVLPEGTEISMLRYLDFLYERWLLKKENHQDRVRFSCTKSNELRISTLALTESKIGIDEKFRENKENIYLNKRMGKKGIRKIGYYSNHPKRHEIKDLIGIECHDDFYITPTGITSSVMEAVTKLNPRGRKDDLLVPGNIRIPMPVDREFYKYPLHGNDFNNPILFPLLPKIFYQVYRGDQFIGVETYESVHRDMLTFEMALRNLWSLPKLCKELEKRVDDKEHLAMFIGEQLDGQFKPEFEERKRNCLEMLNDEPDEAAVRIAKKLIEEIEEYLKLAIKYSDND